MIIPSNEVWVCGMHHDDQNGNDWVIVGVFSCREKAVAHCDSVMYFVAPMKLDVVDNCEEWDGYYRPLVN